MTDTNDKHEPDCTVAWEKRGAKQVLVFRFLSRLSHECAARAIEEWRKAFAARGRDKITIIWDCTRMTGYDTEARLVWQEALKEMKPGIEKVWLISGSGLIRMGASVMSLFTSFDMKVVKSEAEISF